jgi:hypothetical protein
MTWRGCDPAIECKTIDEFRAYLQSLSFSSWRPSGMVLHNTASPTLAQWWGGGTPPAERMKNLRNYYENDMGWSAGPHAFVDGVSIWIFTDFNVKGVHSPSYNGTRLGIEAVGDYDVEDDETGAGAKVMELTAKLFGECHSFFGWEPGNDSIKLHKEDPSTDHDCPGKNILKDEFVDDVNEYMGDGGDDHDRRNPPQHGVVTGVPDGDMLYIRATASESSISIGMAVNGDRVEIVGEAYNGATRWLRLEVGSARGPDVFGWVAAKYIEIQGELPPSREWRSDITATVFGHEGDEQETAYGGWVDADVAGVALPYKWSGNRPRVIVQGPKDQVETEIVDLGPWNTHNPSYVLEGFRPLAEEQYADKVPAQNGQIPTNDAGIDLTPPVASKVGVDGKGKVRWRFA